MLISLEGRGQSRSTILPRRPDSAAAGDVAQPNLRRIPCGDIAAGGRHWV